MFTPLVLPRASSTLPHRAFCDKNAACTHARPHILTAFPRRVDLRNSRRVRQPALSGARSAKCSQGHRAVSTRAAASDGSSGEVVKGVLLDLRSYDDRVPAAGAFERVDDVVMGGVSSSKLVPAKQRECLVWSGQCRTDGGGFAGMRTKPLSKGMDLSQWQGLALCCALESDAEPERRTWKATLRTQNDRGEVVYQVHPKLLQAQRAFSFLRVFAMIDGDRPSVGRLVVQQHRSLDVTLHQCVSKPAAETRKRPCPVSLSRRTDIDSAA